MLELIEKICEVINSSKNFKKVIIKGDKTNVVIEKSNNKSKKD